MMNPNETLYRVMVECIVNGEWVEAYSYGPYVNKGAARDYRWEYQRNDRVRIRKQKLSAVLKEISPGSFSPSVEWIDV